MRLPRHSVSLLTFLLVFAFSPQLVSSDTTVSGTISSDTTWTTAGGVYIVNGPITVNSGVTLTIDPGVIVKLGTSQYIQVSGTLNVNGTEESPVYFTSLKDDTVGGDTNGDGSATSPAAENWGYVGAVSGGVANIDHAVMRYAGKYTSYTYGAVYNNAGVMTLTNSAVATSSVYGIYTKNANASTTLSNVEVYGNTNGVYVNNGRLTIASSTIRNNGTGIYLSTGTTTVEASDVAYNTSYGFRQAGGYSFIHASSTIHNSTNGVYVTGGKSDIKYSRIYNNTNYGVYTNGAPTLVQVSEVYGNTYGMYVGGGTAATIGLKSSSVHDNTYGCYINSGNASIGSNSFQGNSSYGVYKVLSGNAVATYNYWGAANGPSGQGPGSGDAVSTYVSYAPFLTEPHYILVDETGSKVSSVDESGGIREIRWGGDPSPYQTTWYSAVDIWNALGSVNIATDTLETYEDLTISTTTRADLPYPALWQNRLAPLSDTITLNGYYLDTYNADDRLNVIAHELGHALGLAHSHLDNIMHYIVTGMTELGAQDESDYYYLWPL